MLDRVRAVLDVLRVGSSRSVLDRGGPCWIAAVRAVLETRVLDHRGPCWWCVRPCWTGPVRAVLCCRVLAVRAVLRTSLFKTGPGDFKQRLRA